jgi:hypothetical protein
MFCFLVLNIQGFQIIVNGFLQKSLQFWRAFCKSHQNEPKFYKLAAHELDTVSFEHTKGNILMGTQVFELFPELSVLEAMPENQFLEISLMICKNMIHQDMLLENYIYSLI